MAYTSGLTLPQVVRQMRADAAETSPATPMVAAGSRPAIDLDSMRDEEITGELIGEGLAAGDRFCGRVVERYADYLAIGLHNLYQVLDPGLFVIGGGLTGWGPPYIDRARERFRALVQNMTTQIPEIRLSELGADAAVIGAAALPLEGR